MKILFLDFDGVLNNETFFIKRHRNMRELRMFDLSSLNKDAEMVKHLLGSIDLDNLDNLKEIINKTNSLVVVTSSWKQLNAFKSVSKYLIKYGIPIIDRTYDNGSDRGTGIKNYLNTKDIENYIVIDDEIFADYDDEIMNHLVKTSFYNRGLDEECTEKAIKLLNMQKSINLE